MKELIGHVTGKKKELYIPCSMQYKSSTCVLYYHLISPVAKGCLYP